MLQFDLFCAVLGILLADTWRDIEKAVSTIADKKQGLRGLPVSSLAMRPALPLSRAASPSFLLQALVVTRVHACHKKAHVGCTPIRRRHRPRIHPVADAPQLVHRPSLCFLFYCFTEFMACVLAVCSPVEPFVLPKQMTCGIMCVSGSNSI